MQLEQRYANAFHYQDRCNTCRFRLRASLRVFWMPIKFRCQKCRQFLGISRALAGQVVDCPTCGRATRVPNLDGSREPIPSRPELDRGDSSLLNALDQLADLGKAETQKQRVAEPESAAVVAPVESAKPIAIEPLRPSGVVEAPGDAKSKADPSANTSVDSEVVLKKLAASAVPAPPVEEPRRSGLPIGLLVAAIAGGAALFAGGWFLGRLGMAEAPAADANVDVRAEPDPLAATLKIDGLTGRITYRKSESECLADRGARIIAWPVGFSPDEKWAADGFRTGDSKQLTSLAQNRLIAGGGSLAIAGEDGEFKLELTSGDDYEVLILSRFGGREIDGQGMSSAELSRLETCFAEPRKLVGKVQFRLVRMKYRGQGQQLLDQVFEVAN